MDGIDRVEIFGGGGIGGDMEEGVLEGRYGEGGEI